MLELIGIQCNVPLFKFTNRCLYAANCQQKVHGFYSGISPSHLHLLQSFLAPGKVILKIQGPMWMNSHLHQEDCSEEGKGNLLLFISTNGRDRRDDFTAFHWSTSTHVDVLPLPTCRSQTTLDIIVLIIKRNCREW